KFDLIYRSINPLNIIELKLIDDDNKTLGQIKSFIKIFQINKFNLLKSLDLIQINENMKFYQADYIQWRQSSQIKHLTLLNLNINQFIQIIEKSNKFQSIILKVFQ
ncbi:unnamed protein product, partial [Rotaria sp. Silwood1]